MFDTKLAKDNVDTMKGFRPSEDTIRLDDAIFKNMKSGLFGANTDWLNWDAFHVGSKAADAEDRIVYNSKTGGLYYDKDGAGGSEQVKFAQLDKHLTLTAWDFQIV
jgi:Ca2+-binding RTX toxin-like protein